MKKVVFLSFVVLSCFCLISCSLLEVIPISGTKETGNIKIKVIGLAEGCVSDVIDENKVNWECVIPKTTQLVRITSIGGRAFEFCHGLTSVTIPDSVTSIGGMAFYDCENLTSVTIPDSVTSIGEEAFSGCASLTSVAIPGSVTSIGKRTFSGCTSLTSVAIPDSVTAIGEKAFYDCENLTSVTIGASVATIGDNAFSGCDNLAEIHAESFTMDEWKLLMVYIEIPKTATIYLKDGVKA